MQTLDVGGLSAPSKMPCYAYSIPAKACQTGAKLARTPGTVCAGCYALKGRYNFPNVQTALARRLATISDPQWVPAMVALIRAKERSGFFRWHDSGDLQSVDHLRAIVEIARALPGIQFWLPTREFGFVGEFIRGGGKFPGNLTVRLSALKVDGPPPTELATRLGCVTSTVSSEEATCPAPEQGNKCGPCRACWDRGTANVAYRLH